MIYLFNIIPLSRSNGMPLAVRSFTAALKKKSAGADLTFQYFLFLSPVQFGKEP